MAEGEAASIALAALPMIPLKITLTTLEADCRKLIGRLRPSWSADRVELKRLTAGITNVIMKCKSVDQDNVHPDMLIRIYGKNTEVLIDRERELRNHALLHTIGLAPAVLGRFNNGYAYDFCPGTPCGPDLVADSVVAPIVARTMGQLHRRAPLRSNAAPSLFPTMREWLKQVPRSYTSSSKAQRVFDVHFSIDALARDIDSLERTLAPLASPVVFCHNDLLCENIIWNPHLNTVNEGEGEGAGAGAGAGGGTATFIDYEYGQANFRGFDVGNHFNEWAGVDEVDYSRYPNDTQQRIWLRHYLAAYTDTPVARVESADVRKLQVEVNSFSLASHLFWTLWALVQAEISAIDFDYMGYGVVRYDEFKRCVKEHSSHL